MIRNSVEHSILESFLQEFDVADFLSFTSKHSQPAATKHGEKTSSPRPAKKVGAPWRQQKEELERLAQRLQSKLAALKAKALQTTGLEGWEDAAKSEKQRRKAAECENLRLKKRVKRCKANVDNVKAIFDIVKANQSLQDNVRTKFPSSVTFDLLERRTNERLAELDCNYLEACAWLSDHDTDQVHVRRLDSEQNTTVLELKCTRLMPYNVDITSDVLWDVMKLEVMSDEEVAIDLHSKDLLVSEGCFSRKLQDGGSVEIRSRCLMKRVAIPEGSFVVIESISQWRAQPQYSSAWRHETRDSGWVVVHPGSLPELCQIQTGLRLQSNKELSRDVIEVMILSFRKILSSRYQLIENMLLGSSRK